MNGQIRERCGLGSPAQEYDQNAYKCENSVIKKLIKMLTINEAIQLIETELESQEENILFITGKG